jgi:small-conductance mechanosensitive channel
MLLEGARGVVVLWCATLGLYLATELAELPPALARILPSSFIVLLIGSLTWTLARVAASVVGSHAVAGKLPAASLVSHTTRLLVLVLGLLVLLQTMGISITPMITALGIGGLAVALALQDTLSNLFAGMQVLLSRQVRPGDFIRLDTPGHEGYVEDVTWRYTSIRQPGTGLLVVPNARLASTTLLNFDRPDRHVAASVELRVAYDEDLDRVERVAREVASQVLHAVPGLVRDAQPVVRFRSFVETGVRLDITLEAIDFAAQGLAKHELIRLLHRRLREDEVEPPGARGGGEVRRAAAPCPGGCGGRSAIAECRGAASGGGTYPFPARPSPLAPDRRRT